MTTSISGGMTESSVRVMIWKLYWSSFRSRLEPMNVKTGIMLCSTRDWEVREGERERDGGRGKGGE